MMRERPSIRSKMKSGRTKSKAKWVSGMVKRAAMLELLVYAEQFDAVPGEITQRRCFKGRIGI